VTDDPSQWKVDVYTSTRPITSVRVTHVETGISHAVTSRAPQWEMIEECKAQILASGMFRKVKTV
jgi:hypothetical protein